MEKPEHKQIIEAFYNFIEEAKNAETEKLKIYYTGNAQGILHVGICTCELKNDEITEMDKICKNLKTWEWM